MPTQDELVYPIIMIGQGFFNVFRDARSAVICSDSALKNRVYETSTFIDSTGGKFQVSAVEKAGYVPHYLDFGYCGGGS